MAVWVWMLTRTFSRIDCGKVYFSLPITNSDFVANFISSHNWLQNWRSKKILTRFDIRFFCELQLLTNSISEFSDNIIFYQFQIQIIPQTWKSWQILLLDIFNFQKNKSDILSDFGIFKNTYQIKFRFIKKISDSISDICA